MTENYLLEVKNVSKSFGVVKALNRIDFNVRPNEIHALCGENGAGKSTLTSIEKLNSGWMGSRAEVNLAKSTRK